MSKKWQVCAWFLQTTKTDSQSEWGTDTAGRVVEVLRFFTQTTAEDFHYIYLFTFMLPGRLIEIESNFYERGPAKVAAADSPNKQQHK